jgi:transposase
MQTVTTIDLDIAKSVFQVRGIDAEGKVLIRCKLKRCLVGIETCAIASLIA